MVRLTARNPVGCVMAKSTVACCRDMVLWLASCLDGVMAACAGAE